MSATLFVVSGGTSMFCGVLLLVGAVVLFVRHRNRLQGYQMARGTVVDVRRDIGMETGGWIYYPIVEFQPSPDEKVRFVSRVGTSLSRTMIGKEVQVRYNPLDPEQAEIDSGTTRLAVPGIMAAMGAVFFCLGCTFVFFSLLLLSSS